MELISREAVIEAIDKNRQDLLSLGMDGAEYILVHYGRRVIEELPNAEVTLCHLDSPCEYQNADIAMPSAQQWIPVSERLPQNLEEVNVTWVNHDPEPYYVFFKDKPATATAVYYKEKWYWYSSTCVDFLAEYGGSPNDEIDDGIEITAWMPLPEPWKGEEP